MEFTLEQGHRLAILDMGFGLNIQSVVNARLAREVAVLGSRSECFQSPKVDTIDEALMLKATMCLQKCFAYLEAAPYFCKNRGAEKGKPQSRWGESGCGCNKVNKGCLY